MIAANKSNSLIKPTKCIVPGCTSEAAKTRGVCPNCYQWARKMEATGVATMDELQERGLILPPHHKDITHSAIFMALEASRADKKVKLAKK